MLVICNKGADKSPCVDGRQSNIASLPPKSTFKPAGSEQFP